MSATAPAVSVIIPTLDRKIFLEETLRSIFKMKYRKDKIEILIIDNGSKDNTIEFLKKVKSENMLLLIENKKNLGFAAALNQGIKRAKGKYILVTNDDVIFDKKCLLELVKVAQKDERVAIVGPKMFFRDKPKRLALPYFRVNLWLGYHPYDQKGLGKTREMDLATGGCMLINTTIFSKIGLFDEMFFFCGEDYDFCFRAKASGFKIIYSPKAILWHGFLRSGVKNFENLFNHYKGKFRFMLIHASALQLLTFFPLQIVFGLGNLLPIFLALNWNIKNLRNAIARRNEIYES